MSTPPKALPIVVDNIPSDLTGQDQWVVWRWEYRNGKWTKVPINAASGSHADSTDPSTWGSFEKAVRCAEARDLPGVGFVFTNSPFAGADLDGCRDLETGRLEGWAWEIVAELDSYTEVSPSGTGVKVFMRGILPPGRRRKGDIEMYDSGRFFTVTGHRLPDAPAVVMERTEQLTALHRRVFGLAPGNTPKRPARSIASLHGASLGDAELIRRAAAAPNGGKFAALWRGDTSGYAGGGNEGRSEADLALCSMLAFWTGPDRRALSPVRALPPEVGRAALRRRPDLRAGNHRARPRGALGVLGASCKATPFQVEGPPGPGEGDSSCLAPPAKLPRRPTSSMG